MVKRNQGGASKTLLVRSYPYGTDPASPLPMPTPSRTAVTLGAMSRNGRRSNGRVSDSALGGTPVNGTFVVADNDFSTGRAVIHVGDYEVVSNVDFAPGVGVNQTATAVAAAINRLPGFAAVAAVATVSVTWSDGPFDEVDFYALHFGTHTNFTPFTPATGLMAVGRPTIVAPLITP